MKKMKKIAVFTAILVVLFMLFSCDDNTDKNENENGNSNEIVVPGTTLAQKLQWLKYNVKSGNTYLIEVSADREFLAPQSLQGGYTIRLRGKSANRVIQLSSKGSLCSIYSGSTLILDDNISLVGINNNENSLIYVGYGGTFIMNGGTISGNTNNTYTDSIYDGGGVYVIFGTFIMNGGTISSNTTTGNNFGGGGVYVYSDGTFIKSGGGTITGYADDTVNGNVVKNSSGVVQSNKGHAVYVDKYYNNSLYVIRKETTAGSNDNLSYIGGTTPTWDGVWDY